MDLSKKVWMLKFCEGTLDGLVRCYLLDSTQGYRLLWGAVGDVKAHPALEKPGIYFVVEKKAGKGKPHIYVGQATERKNKNGMLNRLKEHRRKGEFAWADDVVFLPTPEKFGSTELNFLENHFYSLVVEAGSYEAQNAIDPHRSKPRDEIMWIVESFVEDAESILAIFGHRPFLKVEDSVASSELPKPTKEPKEPRKPKQPLLPLPSDAFVCESRGVMASGKIVADGFVVLKGSQMAREPTKSFHTFAKAYELWKLLQKDGAVINGIFTRDCHFSAASTAAAVVIAGTANGNKMWKRGKKTLGDFLKGADGGFGVSNCVKQNVEVRNEDD